MLCVSPEWFEKMYSLLANITTHLHACLWLLQSMWDSVGTLLASKLAGRYRFFKNPPVQVCLSVFLSCFHMCDEHAGKPGNSGKWQIISHHNASRRWLFLKSLYQFWNTRVWDTLRHSYLCWKLHRYWHGYFLNIFLPDFVFQMPADQCLSTAWTKMDGKVLMHQQP